MLRPVRVFRINDALSSPGPRITLLFPGSVCFDFVLTGEVNAVISELEVHRKLVSVLVTVGVSVLCVNLLARALLDGTKIMVGSAQCVLVRALASYCP